MTASASSTAAFTAPWGIEVKIMTIGGSAVCLGLPFYFANTFPAARDFLGVSVLNAPLLLWLLCFLFSVRGYSIHGSSLLIHRLIWSTRVSLDGLQAIDLNAAPFDRTIRLLGNPGIFGICGFFYNRRIGRFKAFVTNKRDAILLRFESGTIALSPGERRRFLEVIFAAAY